MSDTIFKNKQVQQHFEAKGYAVLRNIIPDELLDKMKVFGEGSTKGTNQNPEGAALELFVQKNATADTFQTDKDSLERHLQAQLLGYKIENRGFAFLNKKPHHPVFGLHSHAMMVDIRHYKAIVIWIPTIDVDEKNGALWMKPSIFSNYTYEFDQANLKERSELVSMKKGDVLFFDNRIQHWSDVNVTDNNRLSVVFMAISKDAKLITHHVREEKGAVIIDLYDFFMGGKTHPRMLADKTPFDSFIYKHKVIPVTSTAQLDNTFETESELKTGQLYKLWRKLPASFRKRFFDIIRG